MHPTTRLMNAVGFMLSGSPVPNAAVSKSDRLEVDHIIAALRLFPIQADKILAENSSKTFMFNEPALIRTQRCRMNRRQPSTTRSSDAPP